MRSEVWRPAAAARNRSSREARDPVRQALRPGCEELAVTDPDVRRSESRGGNPRRKRGPGSQKPPRWSAGRRASRVNGCTLEMPIKRECDGERRGKRRGGKK